METQDSPRSSTESHSSATATVCPRQKTSSSCTRPLSACFCLLHHQGWHMTRGPHSPRGEAVTFTLQMTLVGRDTGQRGTRKVRTDLQNRTVNKEHLERRRISSGSRFTAPSQLPTPARGNESGKQDLTSLATAPSVTGGERRFGRGHKRAWPQQRAHRSTAALTASRRSDPPRLLDFPAATMLEKCHKQTLRGERNQRRLTRRGAGPGQGPGQTEDSKDCGPEEPWAALNGPKSRPGATQSREREGASGGGGFKSLLQGSRHKPRHVDQGLHS